MNGTIPQHDCSPTVKSNLALEAATNDMHCLLPPRLHNIGSDLNKVWACAVHVLLGCSKPPHLPDLSLHDISAPEVSLKQLELSVLEVTLDNL